MLPSVTSLQKSRIDIPLLPRTIRVDDDGYGDYTTIRQALAHANTNDIIEVYSGTYYERDISISTTLTIQGIPHDLGYGNDEGTPVVMGDNGENSTIFIITADHVTLAGLNITNEVVNGNRTAYAVLLSSSDFTTIANNKIQNNFYGICLEESNNNIIINNEINNNWIGLFTGSSGYGAGSSSNQINSNYIHHNRRRGLVISIGTNNVLRSNHLTHNKLNFGVIGTQLEHFQHDIDMSNTIESKPILYLKNQENQEISSDIGYLGLINCNNLYVHDLEINWNQEGILLVNTRDTRIDQVTVTNTIDGIHLINSHDNTISNNTLRINEKGIYLSTSSNGNTIEHNEIYYNMLGITVETSSFNTFFKNILTSNNYGIFGYGQHNQMIQNTFERNLFDTRQSPINVFSGNVFSHSLQPQMITFEEVPRIIPLDGLVTMSFLLYSPDGTPNTGTDYHIKTSPQEPLTITQNQNNILVAFHVTRPGTYSLIIESTDEFGNTAHRIIAFYVNPTGEETTHYYLRVVEPLHGQPLSYVSTDVFTFLFSPPQKNEWERCAMWVQNSPDELPTTYPLSLIKDMTISSWIKFLSNTTMGFHGIALERYATYNMILGNGYDRYVWLEQPTTFTWFDVDLLDLNWGMDYPWSWYWFALKLQGGGPCWLTKPDQPSTLDITSLFTTTPTIKSLANPNITIYSATSPRNDLNTATINLDGTGTASLVTQMYNPSLIYSVVYDGFSSGSKSFSFTQQNGELTLSFKASGEHTFDIIAVPNGVQLDGQCTYPYEEHSNNLDVQITNLNAEQSWMANTLNGEYSLVLSSISDIHTGDILRYTVTDDQANYNITDHVITEAEISAGHISLDVVVNLHYRTLAQFPYYAPATNSGAMSMKMMLDYLQWNSLEFPLGPPSQHEEDYYDHYAGDDGSINGSEFAFGLNTEIDDIHHNWEYGYFYQPLTHANENDALRDIVIWFDYAIDTFNDRRTIPVPKEGYTNYAPVAVPLDGVYDHWVVIRGIQTNRNAWFGQDIVTDPISIYGFWVNDPTPNGLGENTFVAASWFTNEYYVPIAIPDDEHYGNHISIVDPAQNIPLIAQNVQVHPALLPSQKSHSPFLIKIQRDDMMTSYAFEQTSYLLQNTPYYALFIQAIRINKPVYNKNTCMVTFHADAMDFLVLVNSMTGALLEVHLK